jgi:hypothetical protein
MEDDLDFSGNERRPQFQKMEDNLNFHEMEEDLNFSGNETKYFLDISNVNSKFPIKNNLQFNFSQPSLT